MSRKEREQGSGTALISKGKGLTNLGGGGGGGGGREGMSRGGGGGGGGVVTGAHSCATDTLHQTDM